MKTDVEDLLRDSLQRQATRAVPPERVLAGLPEKAAARQARRWLTGSAVAAPAIVVAAIAIAPTLLRQPSQAGTGIPIGAEPGTGGDQHSSTGDQHGSTGGQHGTGDAQHGTGVPSVSTLMQYDVTWVPAGLAERVRSTPPEGIETGPSRIWSADPVDATVDVKGTRLELNVWHGALPDTSGERVTINGRTGYYVSAGGKSYVQWTVPGGVALNLSQHSAGGISGDGISGGGISGGGISKADLLHAASSVRPSTDRVEVPIAVGWLPEGFVLDYAEAAGNSTTFYRLSRIGQDNSLDTRSPREQKLSPVRDISIVVAPFTDAPDGGAAVTVGGHPGRYVTKPLPQEPKVLRYFVVVDLGDGRLLTVSGFGSWTQADLMHVAEHIQVGPNPDLSWLGTS